MLERVYGMARELSKKDTSQKIINKYLEIETKRMFDYFNKKKSNQESEKLMEFLKEGEDLGYNLLKKLQPAIIDSAMNLDSIENLLMESEKFKEDVGKEMYEMTELCETANNMYGGFFSQLIGETRQIMGVEGTKFSNTIENNYGLITKRILETKEKAITYWKLKTDITMRLVEFLDKEKIVEMPETKLLEGNIRKLLNEYYEYEADKIF